MNLVNLTPHEIVILDENKHVLHVVEPTYPPARVEVRSKHIGYIHDIPVNQIEYGEVTGLPEPKPDTIYIVSSKVAQALPYRADIYSPDTSTFAVRDTDGNIIGVRALISMYG